MTGIHLNRGQVAARIGVEQGTLSRMKLPEPDVIVGPVEADGKLPRSIARGWLPETIDAWNAARPGRGARTDLADKNG